MTKSVNAQCATTVSLFRGLYGRVARELGVDVSYMSRIARGERKFKVAEKVLAREFCRALALMGFWQTRSFREFRFSGLGAEDAIYFTQSAIGLTGHYRQIVIDSACGLQFR